MYLLHELDCIYIHSWKGCLQWNLSQTTHPAPHTLPDQTHWINITSEWQHHKSTQALFKSPPITPYRKPSLIPSKILAAHHKGHPKLQPQPCWNDVLAASAHTAPALLGMSSNFSSKLSVKIQLSNPHKQSFSVVFEVKICVQFSGCLDHDFHQLSTMR